MSNKKSGNQGEKVFADMMFKRGWWVHIFADKATGQPFDVVMAKEKITWFLDVKVVEGKDYFLHSRMEENQLNAFKMLLARGVTNTGFVCRFDDGWYLLKYNKIDQESKRTRKADMIKITDI